MPRDIRASAEKFSPSAFMQLRSELYSDRGTRARKPTFTRNGGGGGSCAESAGEAGGRSLNTGADTKTERSEGLVEAAGVEPASESTSPRDPTCVFPFELSQPAKNGTKRPGRPSRKISLPRSGRPAATSLLNDGRPPRRRQPRGDRSLVIKQRERSQYSQLANVHRIYEEMALGTRPTFQYPRRSQVAPKR